MIEAVRWKRVVVDEIHQVFESARDVRSLRLLQTRALWGLTATPAFDDDLERAQHLYTFLHREKPHHPNLLACLSRGAVRAWRIAPPHVPSPRSTSSS